MVIKDGRYYKDRGIRNVDMEKDGESKLGRTENE